jgi:tetratricopeptide (TPR) repeat protein
MVRLTRREREVLVELCRPILDRASFHEPAPTRDIARALFVTEAAVKQHLLRMYEKLAVPESGNRRRALANAAFEQGILSASELGAANEANAVVPPASARGLGGQALAAGRTAFAERRWEDAYARLAEADVGGELDDPADLAALGEAALWTARHSESISARQRAYAAYVEAKNADAAVRVAADLFINFIVRGKFACGAGWLSKGGRLIEAQPDSPARGCIAAMEALLLLATGKLEEAAARATTAMEVGAKHGDRDAYTLGQTFMACVLARSGETERAMPLFDEAMATATSGELGTLATGVVYCRTLCTCLDQMDYRRASEWTETIEQESGRAGGGLPGDCRAHLAAVLSAAGEWERAAEEARAACDEAMRFDFGHVGLAAYELGLVRLRMGDISGAEDAFKRTHELGAVAEPGLSLLRLARGDAAAAAASIEAALASTPSSDPFSRARHLPAKIEILLASGDREGARAASKELEAIATRHPGSPGIVAASAHGAGVVAAALGAHGEAIIHLRKSCRDWSTANVPFEAARSRHELGMVLVASGDRAGAALELGVARDAFERLGVADLARKSAEALTLTSA